MSCILKNSINHLLVKCIPILALCVFSISSYSQEFEKWVEKGDESTQLGFYKTALQQYEVALKFEKNNTKILYKCAEAARLYNSYTEAIQWYENIITLNAEKQFSTLYYHLGEMYKNVGKYDTAIIYFEKYLDKIPRDEFIYTKATNEISSCKWALQNNQAADTIAVKHLKNKVNTKNSESAAILINDSVLLFTSLRDVSYAKFDDQIIPDLLISNIYESKKKGNNYGVAELNDWGFNNGRENTANTCFDKLNRRMYFTHCSNESFKETKCNIYYSDLKKDNRWTRPKKLSAEVNISGYTATQPAIEIKDGKTILYFVSDCPNGNGGFDIWYSIIENGKCSKAINIGYPVNTKGNEVTPYYNQQTQTLYFSSDYHYGFGGYDIFQSKGSINQWSVPENLGKPINSPANDLYYSIEDNSLSGFLTSNRVGSFFIDNKTCCNDIYEWHVKEKNDYKSDTISLVIDSIPVVENKKQIDSLLPIKLYFHNDEPEPKSNKLNTEKTYKQLYASYAELKDIYVKNYTKELTKNLVHEAEEQITYFFTQEMELNNNKLNAFITYLLDDLKKGKNIRLIVRGYASPLYTSTYNKNLSKRRISSFINQLLKAENGIISQYINNENIEQGSLEIIELALGSSTADASVSSNPHDLRNSIYSLAAAKERRIEIISYNYQDTIATNLYDEQKSTSSLLLGKELFLLGKIPQKKSIQLEIPIFNNSTEPQEIELLDVGCSCIKAYSTKEIQPKENGFVFLDINTLKQEAGIYLVTITVKLRSESFSQTIFIEYQIEK